MSKRSGRKAPANVTKAVGTISNKISNMSEKDRNARRKRALHSITQSEIDVLKKYNLWDKLRRGY